MTRYFGSANENLLDDEYNIFKNRISAAFDKIIFRKTKVNFFPRHVYPLNVILRRELTIYIESKKTILIKFLKDQIVF